MSAILLSGMLADAAGAVGCVPGRVCAATWETKTAKKATAVIARNIFIYSKLLLTVKGGRVLVVNDAG